MVPPVLMRRAALRPNYRTIDEPRVPLLDRGGGDWTGMESVLFNLITQAPDRPKPMVPFLFSRRLACVQAMLDAYDACLREYAAAAATGATHG